jgi:hypothetical protein
LFCLFFLIFGLPLWYLLAIVLSILLDIRIRITSLVSFGHCFVYSSWYSDSDYTFGIFWPLFCLFFLIFRLWLPPFGIFKLFLITKIYLD